MDISISEQNQERILRKIESGKYGSLDDVIARALELLDKHDEALAQELAGLHDKVRQGIAEADAGHLIPASDVFDELRRRNATFNRRDQ